VAMKGMNYRTQVTEVEQYRRNASEAWSWMDHSDDILDKATKAMQRIEYLAGQAANDTYSANERLSIKQEVEQLQEQLAELANTRVNGKYIFNGTNTDTPPIRQVETNGEISYEVTFGEGDNLQSIHDVNIEVSDGILFNVNVSPEGVFDEQLFESIQGFIDALDQGEDVDFDESIGALNESTLNIINGRAALGARMNRLELIEDRLSQQEIIAKDTMAKNE